MLPRLRMLVQTRDLTGTCCCSNTSDWTDQQCYLINTIRYWYLLWWKVVFTPFADLQNTKMTIFQWNDNLVLHNWILTALLKGYPDIMFEGHQIFDTVPLLLFLLLWEIKRWCEFRDPGIWKKHVHAYGTDWQMSNM